MAFKTKFPRALFFGSTMVSATAGIAVLIFMVVLGLPIITSGSLLSILTDPWSPDHGKFGIYAMVVGTVYIAALSIIISLPISMGTALFIDVFAPEKLRKALDGAIRLMTAIPTVIYGFVGIFFLVPIVRQLGGGSGMGVLTAGSILALLIAPTMIIFFLQSFRNVPKSYLNAIDALGSTPLQKVIHVIIPNAWQGMLTGIILAFGRAMGDTLIALMLSGNAVSLPESIFDSTRTLTAHIALVIAADFHSVEFKTIFICGIILYLITALGLILARKTDKEANK
ncbi:MAG: phosphate transport system permease protein [Moritella sp.]|jgi:phosphate transport system permease protein